MTTTMEQAFARSGVSSARAKLSEAAKVASEAHPRSFDLAKAALWKAVQDDPSIMADLFKDYRDRALSAALKEYAGREMGQCGAEAQSLCSPPRPASPSKQKRMAVMTAISEAYPSPLYWRTEMGIVGKLTRSQLLALADRRADQAQIFRSLAQPLPSDESIVGDFYSDDEAIKVVERVKK